MYFFLFFFKTLIFLQWIMLVKLASFSWCTDPINYDQKEINWLKTLLLRCDQMGFIVVKLNSGHVIRVISLHLQNLQRSSLHQDRQRGCQDLLLQLQVCLDPEVCPESIVLQSGCCRTSCHSCSVCWTWLEPGKVKIRHHIVVSEL